MWDVKRKVQETGQEIKTLAVALVAIVVGVVALIVALMK